MIFIGDIAWPLNDEPLAGGMPDGLFSDAVIANLEGCITDPENVSLQDKKIFNSPAVLKYLKYLNVKLVSLANNHIFDACASTAPTMDKLNGAEILSCGAGDNLVQAERPAVMDVNGRRVVFLAFGWGPINCRTAAENRPGVNPLCPGHVLSSVEKARREYPDAAVILLMHWNYELEFYPQPMHRQIAFAAIDAGADLIAGSHSHCVQGVEIYRGAPVIYCLGNWFFHQGKFFGGKLKYPSFTNRQLAVEWDPDKNDINCHWFEYDPSTDLINYHGSEPLAESSYIKEMTPFNGFTNGEYVKWFRKNRRKKLGLPVYSDMDADLSNTLRNNLVALRQKLIGLLVKSGFKKGPK